MNVLSKTIFVATYNSYRSLTQQSRSLYSAGAIATTRDHRQRCSVSVESFPQLSLATMASLPVTCSRSTEGRGKLGKINSILKDMMQCIHRNGHGSMTAEEKFKERINAKEKTVKFHVYVQDLLGGANPTVWEVAKSDQTVNSPTAFGDVRVVDDLLTAEADRNSEKLGRTQGTITNSDMSESAITMNLTFNFTGGEYKGNTITIGGRNPLNNKDREMPIVGGTGLFRMARGYVISNTISFDSVTKYGVLEYTFFVAYPDQQEI